MSSKSASMDRGSRDAKLEAIRRQNAADKRRQRIITGVTASVIVVLLAAVGVVIWQAASEEGEQAAADPAGITTVTGRGVEGAEGGDIQGIEIGPADADVTVTIFEDYLCPACRVFEETSGEFISSLPDDDVRVVFAPLAFLDRNSPSQYSTRSASAVACVANDDPEQDKPVFSAFSDLLFTNQPAEGGPDDLDNEQLAELAAGVGAPQSAQDCIIDEGFSGWVDRATADAQQAGVGGTPTIWINGEPTQARTPDELQAAIDAVRAG